MPIKYCSKCASKTEYTAKIPKFCANCGIDFSKAFMPSEVTIGTSVPESITNKQVIKARPKIQRANIEGVEVEESDSFDRSNVDYMANELVASLSGSDFFSAKAKEKSITLGDLFKNPEKFDVGQRTAETSQPSE